MLNQTFALNKIACFFVELVEPLCKGSTVQQKIGVVQHT